jgi:Tfp pilus assembly protein FimT
MRTNTHTHTPLLAGANMNSFAHTCALAQARAYAYQLQYLARQSRATHKGARGSWGTWNKPFTRQNAIKKFENINVVTTITVQAHKSLRTVKLGAWAWAGAFAFASACAWASYARADTASACLCA